VTVIGGSSLAVHSLQFVAVSLLVRKSKTIRVRETFVLGNKLRYHVNRLMDATAEMWLYFRARLEKHAHFSRHYTLS